VGQFDPLATCRSTLAALARLPHEHGRTVLAVLSAYFDESGIHGNAPLCVIAGFMGSLRQWQRVEAAYLRAAGPDASDPGLHASEYFVRDPRGRRGGTYKGWSDDRAGRLLDGLVQAVATADVWPIIAALDVEAFRAYTTAERQQLTGRYHEPGTPPLSGAPSKPYYLVLQSVVVQAAKRVKRSDLSVRFIFDAQDQFAPYARELYAYIQRVGLWEIPPRVLGDISFESRANALPLQAADLLAYLWYQRNARQREAIQPEVEAVFNQWAVTKNKLEGDFINKRTMDHLLGKGPIGESKTYLV